MAVTVATFNVLNSLVAAAAIVNGAASGSTSHVAVSMAMSMTVSILDVLNNLAVTSVMMAMTMGLIYDWLLDVSD